MQNYYLIDLAVAHELGHAVQLASTGEIKVGNMNSELQADCYAGQTYRNNDLNTSYQDIAKLYGLIKPIPDLTHGTPDQCSASYYDT